MHMCTYMHISIFAWKRVYICFGEGRVMKAVRSYVLTSYIKEKRYDDGTASKPEYVASKCICIILGR